MFEKYGSRVGIEMKNMGIVLSVLCDFKMN